MTDDENPAKRAKKSASSLEGNRASFTADENALVDALIACGQHHLFEAWP